MLFEKRGDPCAIPLPVLETGAAVLRPLGDPQPARGAGRANYIRVPVDGPYKSDHYRYYYKAHTPLEIKGAELFLEVFIEPGVEIGQHNRAVFDQFVIDLVAQALVSF